MSILIGLVVGIIFGQILRLVVDSQWIKRIRCQHKYGIKFNDGGFDVCHKCGHMPIKPNRK